MSERGVLRQHCETEALDASNLPAAIFGFLPGGDERLRSSVLAIAEELTEDGFVLRYRTEETDDGLEGKEGSFATWQLPAGLLAPRADRGGRANHRLSASPRSRGSCRRSRATQPGPAGRALSPPGPITAVARLR